MSGLALRSNQPGMQILAAHDPAAADLLAARPARAHLTDSVRIDRDTNHGTVPAHH